MSFISALSTAVDRMIHPAVHDFREFAVLARPTPGGDVRMPGGGPEDWYAPFGQEPAHTLGKISAEQAGDRVERMVGTLFEAPYPGHNFVTEAGAFARYTALSQHSRRPSVHVPGRMLVNGGRQEDAKYLVMEPDRGLLGVIQNQWGVFMKPGDQGHWITGAHVMVAKKGDIMRFFETHGRPLKPTNDGYSFMAQAARAFLEKQVLPSGRRGVTVRVLENPKIGSHFAKFDRVVEASAPDGKVKVVIARLKGGGTSKESYVVFFINRSEGENLKLKGDIPQFAVKLGDSVSRFERDEQDDSLWTVSSAVKPDAIEYPMITELARLLIQSRP